MPIATSFNRYFYIDAIIQQWRSALHSTAIWHDLGQGSPRTIVFTRYETLDQPHPCACAGCQQADRDEPAVRKWLAARPDAELHEILQLAFPETDS